MIFCSRTGLVYLIQRNPREKRGRLDGVTSSGKKWRNAHWLNAMNSGKSDELENSCPRLHNIFFLNLDCIAARSPRSFRSNELTIQLRARIQVTCAFLIPS